METNLYLEIRSFQYQSVVTSYSILAEISKPTEDFFAMIILGLTSFCCSLYIIIALIYPGECLKAEGCKTVVVTSQIMNKVESNDGKKLALVFFMTQLKARNVIVQNSLFKFEWNTFIVVSLQKKNITVD